LNGELKAGLSAFGLGGWRGGGVFRLLAIRTSLPVVLPVRITRDALYDSKRRPF
jgi:hypothetical protein